MGGFLNCPECGEPMFVYMDYDKNPPEVYHSCGYCGYNSKDISYYKKDPAKFVKDYFDIELLPYQKKILEMIK